VHETHNGEGGNRMRRRNPNTDVHNRVFSQEKKTGVGKLQGRVGQNSRRSWTITENARSRGGVSSLVTDREERIAIKDEPGGRTPLLPSPMTRSESLHGDLRRQIPAELKKSNQGKPGRGWRTETGGGDAMVPYRVGSTPKGNGDQGRTNQKKCPSSYLPPAKKWTANA